LNKIIDRYRVYFIIPVIIAILQIIAFKSQNDSCIICKYQDIRTFYLGIVNTWENPTLAYDVDYLTTNGALPYYYLPFFALIFFVFTLGGYDLFVYIFNIGDLLAFWIALFILDELLRKKKIDGISRILYLIISLLGHPLTSPVILNQSKGYLFLAIMLILFCNEQGYSKLIINILFIFVISIMPVFGFWYIYHLLVESKVLYKKTRLTKKTLTETDKIFRMRNIIKLTLTTFKPFILAMLIFVVFNFYNPIFIQIYWEKINSIIRVDSDYLIRSNNAILPYILIFFFDKLEINILIFILVIIFAGIWAFSHYYNTQEFLGLFLLLTIIFNPFNEEIHFVYIFPLLFYWTAHSFDNSSIVRNRISILVRILYCVIIFFIFNFENFARIGLMIVIIFIIAIEKHNQVLETK
jgi:hypothetical protein